MPLFVAVICGGYACVGGGNADCCCGSFGSGGGGAVLLGVELAVLSVIVVLLGMSVCIENLLLTFVDSP